MDTPQLDAFITVVDIGSFTRAAARLRLSQPTVTTRIKTLEQGLGTTLLERLPGGIRPTAAGVELLPYAREIVALTGRARRAVASGGQPHGRVDVGTVESLTCYRLLPLIEYLYRRYPKVLISTRSSPAGDTLSEVRDGRLDCAFIVDPMTRHEGLETRVLCAEPLVLVANRDHLLVNRHQVTNEDLCSAALIRADGGARYHRQFEDSIGLSGHDDRRRVFELDSIDAVKQSVTLGMGMALVPEVTVARELVDGRLRRIDWTPTFEAFTQVVWRRDGGANPALDSLVSAAVQVVREQATSPC
ncbi:MULTISPECIES: LysR family transcriptional regulator [unclassified Micromonospora]|uniref:LysR family transcriptional regulator n=1 Tax=unclassified Micromonospora TaxID=2617518 RepID=UPI0036326306